LQWIELMRITVNVYSSLRYYMPGLRRLFQEKDWEMPEGSTIKQVVEKLQLPGEIRVTVLVNNSNATQNEALKEGDIIHILPQMSGG